jgi:hypothetical protein
MATSICSCGACDLMSPLRLSCARWIPASSRLTICVLVSFTSWHAEMYAVFAWSRMFCTSSAPPMASTIGNKRIRLNTNTRTVLKACVN